MAISHLFYGPKYYPSQLIFARPKGLVLIFSIISGTLMDLIRSEWVANWSKNIQNKIIRQRNTKNNTNHYKNTKILSKLTFHPFLSMTVTY